LIQLLEPGCITPEIVEDDHRSVVDKVKDNWNPEIATVKKEVAKQCSQQHSWEKSVELEMNQAENSRRDPDGCMTAIEPFSQQLLECSPKEELFGKRCQQCHHQQVEQHASHPVEREDHIGGLHRCIFH